MLCAHAANGWMYSTGACAARYHAHVNCHSMTAAPAAAADYRVAVMCRSGSKRVLSGLDSDSTTSDAKADWRT